MSLTTTEQVGGMGTNLNPDQHQFIVSWLNGIKGDEAQPMSRREWAAERISHPELGAGFRTLRRIELVRLCEDNNVPVDGNNSKSDILLQIEGHWRNGGFEGTGATADADIHAYRNILKEAGWPWKEVLKMSKEDMLAAIAKPKAVEFG